MNLFEAYATRLGKQLPWLKRKEAIRNMISVLYDELDAARAKNPDTDDYALMRKIIEEREASLESASYHDRSWALIGITIYPFYCLSLGMALTTSIVAIAAITFGLRGFSLAASWNLLSHVAVAAAVVFSVVTLVFAIGERLGLFVGLSPNSHAPHSPRASAHHRASIKQTAFACSLLVLFDVFPSYVGLPLIVMQPSFHLQIFPVLASGFFDGPRAFIIIWCIASSCWEPWTLSA